MPNFTSEEIECVINTLVFNNEGLIPAIAQQFDSKEILMLAWMNKEAVEKTLYEKRGVYWSRSRNQIWKKGETSGNTQTLLEFRWDCDNDTILLIVDQNGPACHMGKRACFYKTIQEGEIFEKF
ncbi:MAG: phosphoribosyl-AMP cyclohydrolase [Pseudomonadota bacterium]|nr:phosphoribosyl-AMP cyclohydrolase [Pseudomonadota bacterium]